MENQDAAAAPTPARPKNRGPYSKGCAVLVSRAGPVIAAAKDLDPNSVIDARLMTNTIETPSWMGFSLSFPLGDAQRANEEKGFGVRYLCEFATSSNIGHRQR
jgi:hypothetical protein